MSSDIDFAAYHHWPDNWLDNSTSFETSWIAKHIADAATLGKPVSCCISCYSLCDLTLGWASTLLHCSSFVMLSGAYDMAHGCLWNRLAVSSVACTLLWDVACDY